MNEKKQVLITGSGSFVGNKIAQSLSGDYVVVSFARKDLNLLDSEKVKNVFQLYPNIQTVIHCATAGRARHNNSDEGEVGIVGQDLRMFFNLARCVRPDQRLIHLGSGAEYDKRHFRPKMPEEYFDAHVPADSYGFAKYSISRFISQCSNMLCLRIFGLYGDGEDYRYKFISNAIVKGLIGLPITIAQNVVFDYLYIDDLTELIKKILVCEWPYRHMNITPTQSSDIASLAYLANEATCNAKEINILKPGMNIEYTGDNRRLLEVAGPFDFTSYKEGIEKLTNYYQSVFAELDIEIVRADPYLVKCITRE